MASSPSWTKRQIRDHTEAALKLGAIKDELVTFLRSHKSVEERTAINFIRSRYKAHGLVNDSKKEFAIVAFGRNTSEVHYFPKAKGQKLKADSLILLDIWARLPKKNAPYADMTWMFWFGTKVPSDIEKKWQILKKARDTAVKYIEKNILPRGLDIDRIAHDVIGKAGFGECIKHTVGHSLGTKHPHGDLPGINWREYSRILKNVGYTIEPGMYFKDKYGFRTEIDLYISSEGKVIVTTQVQQKLQII
jgi:Xaa-Pro aminopeptidase